MSGLHPPRIGPSKLQPLFFLVVLIFTSGFCEARAQGQAPTPTTSYFSLGVEGFRVFAPKFSKYDVNLYGAQIGFLSELDSAASSPSGGWFMRGTLSGPYCLRATLAVMFRPWEPVFFKAGISYHYVDLNLYFGKMSFHVSNDDLFQNLMLEYGAGLRAGRLLLELTLQHDIRQIRLGAFDIPDNDYTRWGVAWSVAYVFGW
jgi:hypothetical protein